MAQLFPHAPVGAKEVPESASASRPALVDGNGASVPGPRKLVRPKLPAKALAGRAFARREPSPMLTHQASISGAAGYQESSHAEAFYFQKQVQTQTQMVFVLEDGEHIEGHIEWYDRNVIKVKHGSSRILIYKAGIKYLYKAGENHP
jgi:sRNA-binding regulator protein Hfq